MENLGSNIYEFLCWTCRRLIGVAHMRVFADHFSSEPWQWSTMHYWRIGHPLDLTDVVLFFLTMLAMGLLHITRPVLPRYVIALDYPPATASSMAAVCGPTPNCSRSLGACWLISWSSAPQDIHERLWKANPEQCTVLKGIPFKNGEPVQDNPPLPNWCRHTFNNIMHYVIARWTFISSY